MWNKAGLRLYSWWDIRGGLLSLSLSLSLSFKPTTSNKKTLQLLQNQKTKQVIQYHRFIKKLNCIYCTFNNIFILFTLSKLFHIVLYTVTDAQAWWYTIRPYTCKNSIYLCKKYSLNIKRKHRILMNFFFSFFSPTYPLLQFLFN
jgi:hypothetical protein